MAHLMAFVCDACGRQSRDALPAKWVRVTITGPRVDTDVYHDFCPACWRKMHAVVTPKKSKREPANVVRLATKANREK